MSKEDEFIAGLLKKQRPDLYGWINPSAQSPNMIRLLKKSTPFESNGNEEESVYPSSSMYIDEDGCFYERFDSCNKCIASIVPLPSLELEYPHPNTTDLVLISNPNSRTSCFYISAVCDIEQKYGKTPEGFSFQRLYVGDLVQFAIAKRFIVTKNKNEQQGYTLQAIPSSNGVSIEMHGLIGYKRSMRDQFLSTLRFDFGKKKRIDSPSEAVDFPGKVVVSSIGFNVEKGDFCAIVGPSGTGKSTIFKRLLCESQIVFRNDKGDTLGNEQAPRTMRLNPPLEPNQIAYVPQKNLLFNELTIPVSMRYTIFLRGIKATAPDTLWQSALLQAQYYDDIRDGVDNEGRRKNKRISGLSGGQERRLQLASELLGSRAHLLMLDEPTTGLDATCSRNFMTLLRWRSFSCLTVLFITHALCYIEH